MIWIKGKWIAIIAVLLTAVCSGCASELKTAYGPSRGSAGRVSINGFGSLRNSFEEAGFEARDITRLTRRVKQTDVLVWTPRTIASFEDKSTEWMHQWLRSGNKTLVYVLPDSGSEIDYWTDASKLAPPEHRLEYRRRAAAKLNERLMGQMSPRASATNGWFLFSDDMVREPIGVVGGAWADRINGEDVRPSSTSVEFSVYAFDEESYNSVSQLATDRGGQFLCTKSGFAGYSQSHPFNPLVTSSTGKVVIGEVTHKQWSNSRVIVVNSGSLLTNYGFTEPANRRIADAIIEEATPAGDDDLRIGFMLTWGNDISVSESEPGVPKASGMELLTVYPLSLITIHGVFLGVVICLMLFPIFGRPRKVDQTQHSNFGDHLDAVAALMNKAGGEAFARTKISEYLKRMHGETSGRWVIPDKKPDTTTNINAPLRKHFGSGATVNKTQQPAGSNAVNSAQPNATASLLDDALLDDSLGDDELLDVQLTPEASAESSQKLPANGSQSAPQQTRDTSQDKKEEEP